MADNDPTDARLDPETNWATWRLFTLQAGDVEELKPVLTLPVGD